MTDLTEKFYPYLEKELEFAIRTLRLQAEPNFYDWVAKKKP